jgi:hypothetical protein
MSFPKFHGLQLANNSWIENLHVEQLATDPSVVSAGRIWFNTTAGVVKFSVQEGAGVVIRDVYDAASATAASAALQAAINASALTLTGDILAEQTARIAALDAVSLSITSESLFHTTALANAVMASDAKLATETAARVAADQVAAATAADQVATETAARLSGDAALTGRVDAVQVEINATQAGAGLAADGAYVAPVGSVHLDTATSLANAATLLDAALAAEAAARQATDAALASGLANEAQSRVDGDAALSATLTTYINSAVTNNVNADNAETVARIAADTALQTELDQTQASIGLDVDGSLIPITATNYLNGVTTVFGGAAKLDIELKRVDTGLTGEIAGRQAADTQLVADLQAEVAARTTAVAAQQQELDVIEAGAGLEANGSYAAPTGSNYLNASTSLKDADYKLDAAVKAVADQVTAEIAARATIDSAEAARAIAAEAAIQTQVDAIVAASGEGAAALKSSLNAGRFTFKSTVPALSHVITHGLNSEFLLYTVMVEGADLVYRNDIVPVEETTTGSITVTLTEARNIKIVVQKMDVIV